MSKNSRDVENRIYVRNLPYNISNEEFGKVFKRFGPVKTSTIIRKDNGYGETIDRGIGFLTFETKDAYEKCIFSQDPIIVNDRSLLVSPAIADDDWDDGVSTQISQQKLDKSQKIRSGDTKPQEPSENDTIYVANIPITINDVQLRTLFMRFKPYELRIIENEENQTSFAFIRILDSECRDDAIAEMDGYYLDGRYLSVRIAGAPFSDV